MYSQTPPGTATMVFVRFDGETPEGIDCKIGCHGEEKAPPRTRKLMTFVAHGIAAAFLAAGDAGAWECAERLAEHIEEGGAD